MAELTFEKDGIHAILAFECKLGWEITYFNIEWHKTAENGRPWMIKYHEFKFPKLEMDNTYDEIWVGTRTDIIKKFTSMGYILINE